MMLARSALGDITESPGSSRCNSPTGSPKRTFHAPGGRAKRASGETAMMADLLLEVASSPRLEAAWPRVAARLGVNATGASRDSMLLRSIATGKRSCHAVGSGRLHGRCSGGVSA